MCELSLRPGVAFVLACVLFCGVASAQESEFSISGGYSHLYGLHGGDLFHNADGAYVDGDFAWHVPGPLEPLLVGFGVSGSGYWDDHHAGFSGSDYYGGGYVYSYYGDDRLYSDVGFFELEPRVALSLWSTQLPGLYLKPRIGAGLLIDSYGIDQLYNGGTDNAYIDTHYHTGAAFELHPSLQAGYTWGPGAVGGEISYMPAWGDFGRLGNSEQELRLGVFYTFRF